MWCPKCKYEYREGIKVCADCGSALVDNLQKESEPEEREDGYIDEEPVTKQSVDEAALMEMINNLSEEDAEKFRQTLKASQSRNYSYTTKREKYEDNRSSAWTFFIVGGAGLVLVLLHLAGIINFNLSQFSKIMTSVVMGLLFVIFIIVGFISVNSAKKYRIEADEEDALTTNLLTSFRELYTADSIDKLCNASGNDELYEKWQKRYSFIGHFISTECKSNDIAYIEYITDLLYNEYFDV